jgi:hypothetical protein
MRLCLIPVFILPLLASFDDVHAQTATRWATGAALKRQLAESTHTSAIGIPLRQALYQRGRAHQVSILLDRRVDPDQPLTLNVNDLPLEEMLRQIAKQHELGITVLGSAVVYLGPIHYTSRLRTLAQLRHEESRAHSDLAQKLLAVAPFRWPDFSTPRDLLTQLAAEAKLAIEGLGQVPHDLWAQADLPPLPWVDRLTLVAGQYNLTFHIASDGRSIALVPIPDDVSILRQYPAGSQPSRLADQWRDLLPHAQITVKETTISVRARLEDHERLTATSRPDASTSKTTPPNPPQKSRPGDSKKRYTLKQAQGQLDLLLPQLGQRLGLEVRVDREALEQAGISLRKQVSVTVTDATLDELLDALLKPAGCTFRRQGSVVEVVPAK